MILQPAKIFIFLLSLKICGLFCRLKLGQVCLSLAGIGLSIRSKHNRHSMIPAKVIRGQGVSFYTSSCMNNGNVTTAIVVLKLLACVVSNTHYQTNTHFVALLTCNSDALAVSSVFDCLSSCSDNKRNITATKTT